jgi:hypothetical protein
MYMFVVLVNRRSQLIKSYATLPFITLITFCYMMILTQEYKLGPPKNVNACGYVTVTLIYSRYVSQLKECN